MNFDEMKTQHEVDQALAEAIELGTIKEVGDGKYSLTARGVVHSALMVIQDVLSKADQDKRDLNDEEKKEVLSHIDTMSQALKGEKG